MNAKWLSSHEAEIVMFCIASEKQFVLTKRKI